MNDLRGIYPALPTPMIAGGEVNYGALRDLVDFVIGLTYVMRAVFFAWGHGVS